MNIVNIKGNLHDARILTAISLSQYMPTEEKLNDLADDYETDDRIFAFACEDNCFICGVMILKCLSNAEFEIMSIATAPAYRNQGIASRLISFAVSTLRCGVIKAETDDDAVAFYRKYGFQIYGGWQMMKGAAYGVRDVARKLPLLTNNVLWIVALDRRKHTAEIINIAKAAGLGGLGDIAHVVHEHGFRMVDADEVDVSVEFHAHAAVKQNGQIGGRKVHQIRQLLQGDWLVVMLRDVFHNLTHAQIRHGGRVFVNGKIQQLG